jgi:hypothetical protein
MTALSRSAITGLAAALALLACTPRPAAVEVVASPAAPTRDVHLPSPGWLVWTHDEDGAVHTTLVDASSRPVAHADAMVTAIDGRLWALDRARATRDLTPCEDHLGADFGPSVEESLRLIPLDGDAEARSVVRGVFDSTGAKDDATPDVGVVTQTVDVIGSIGPYLFARNAQWAYSCGAHGAWYRTSQVVDLRTGREIDLDADDTVDAERTATERFVAMGQKDQSITTLWENGAPGPLVHAAVEPRLDDGRVGLVHVFLADACYACGGSLWRSYAVETEVPATPPRVVGDMTLPLPVSAFASEHVKAEAFGGFAEVPDVQAAAHVMASAPRIAPRPKT